MKSVRVFPSLESPFEEEEILRQYAEQIVQRYVENIGVFKFLEIVKNKYEYSEIDDLSNGK